MLISNLQIDVEGPVDEATVLNNIDRDWKYRRPNRITKEAVTFRDANNLQYFYAVIKSVEVDGKPKDDWVGKTIGYAGWGSYDDLIVDGGNYVLAPNEKKRESLHVPDFRNKGVNRAMRAPRNTEAIKESNEKNVPLNITLNNNNQSDFYDNLEGFNLNSERQPKWAVDRLKSTGKRRWYVYNEKDEPMQKAWGILKGY